MLAVPDLHRQFIVDTDASDLAFAGVIRHRDENNKERPVVFASRWLAPRTHLYCQGKGMLGARLGNYRPIPLFSLWRSFPIANR